MQPLVSVIIPVYNRLEYLDAALQSVLRQTYRPLEVIVVDDGSSTDVRGHLDRYGDTIRYFRQPNRGLAAARNSGAGLASGEFLAFLDDDDLFLPEKLTLQVAVLLENPEVALVYSDEYLLDAAGCMTPIPVRKDRIPEIPSGDIALDFFCDSFIGVMTVLLRRSVFQELGGFDELLFCNEDDDLWFRIMLNYHAVCSEYVSGARRLHDSNMSRDTHKMTYFQLLCVDKYLKLYPGFILKNHVAVRCRVRSLLLSYISNCVKRCSLPSLKVLNMAVGVAGRLKELLKQQVNDVKVI
jgi:glycosyltransferase involved in cell wall biosynthesis